MSLRPLTRYVTFSVSFSGSGICGHLLEVVDEQHQAPIARQATVLLDELADVVDGAGGLRAAHQEQVLAVARDAVHRRAQARVVGHLGVGLALGHPGPEDLLADILDLDRAGLVGKVRERRLHRDEAVEQVLLVVLEADVEHVRLAAGRDVARHLEGHRRLAGALGATDEQQLAGAQAEADRLVERREAERDRLVLADLAGRDLVVEVDQDVERRARLQASVGGVEAPRRHRSGRGSRRCGFGCLRRVSGLRCVSGLGCVRSVCAHEIGSSRMAASAHRSTGIRAEHPSERTISTQARAAAVSAAGRPARRTSGRSRGCPSRSC